MQLKHVATLLIATLGASPPLAACVPAELGTAPQSVPRPLQQPVDTGFGLKMHPILAVMREHTGVDFAAPIGEPVKAVASGTIVEALYKGANGNYVLIRHAGGVETAYAHMARLLVKAGDCIEKGQVIGHVGNTGLTAGPHLHFEILRDGKPVDPEPLLVPPASPADATKP